MSPLQYVRQRIFHMSQAQFALIAGVSQATVCRWESGQLEPDRPTLKQIRCAAKARKLKWRDSFFWDLPPPAALG